jgi:MFS transporter, ACS family, aldohexuronate transporter
MKYYRWFVITLAFIALGITYLDRVALSYAIGPIETAFHLTNTDFGLIASGFGIGYMIMTLVGGVLVDKYGSHRIWSSAAIIWSLACAMLAFATGFWWLFLFRIALGIAEGPSFPAMTRAAADWLLPKERARALAFALAAVPLSSVIGAPLVSSLILIFNWRIMFISIGSIGIIWSIIWWVYFRDQPEQSQFVSTTELQQIKEADHALQDSSGGFRSTWRFMLFNPALLSNNCAFFAFGYLVFFAMTWLPGYFEQTYHIQLKSIGFFLIIPWLFSAIMLLLGGFLSDWLWQRFRNLRIARSHIIWSSQILSVLCFIAVIFMHSPVMAVIGISFGLGFGMLPNAVFYAINTDLAKDRAGTSLGIMDCAFALAGILAPYFTGKLATMTGNFNSAIYLLCGFTLLGALSVIIFQKPDQVLAKQALHE